MYTYLYIYNGLYNYINSYYYLYYMSHIKILTLIPARSGSKGIVNKNIKQFNTHNYF